MAIKDLDKKLSALAKPANEDSLKNAKFRSENRGWLQKSFEIALLILSALKDKGWSQKQLAETLGVTQQQVSKIIKGKENLTLQTIARIESVLDIQLVEINLVSQVTIYEFEEDFYSFSNESFNVLFREEVEIHTSQELSSMGEPDEPQYTPRHKLTLGIAA